MNIIEHKGNIKDRKRFLINFSKSLLKIIIKKIFYRVDIPTSTKEFDSILLSLEKKYNSKFLNRIEKSYFKKIISDGSIIQYSKSQVANSFTLNYEGEGNEQYRQDNNEIHKTPEITLYSIQNGAVIGCEGYVYDTKTKYFIKESLNFWFKWHKNIFNYYRSVTNFNLPININGITLTICIPGGTGYYHFMIEALTKYLLLKAKFPALIVDNIIVTGKEDVTFIKTWLDFSGNKSKVIFTDFQSHYISKQLLFSNTINFQYSPNKANVFLLRGLIPTHIKNKILTPYKIILATRKSSKMRTIIWEDELINIFNIERIDFSNLSPIEVITNCQECSVLIGAHGAALTNMVFCKPKTKVIEISFGVNEVVYSRLANVCDLNHIIFDITQKEDLILHLKSILNS